MARKNYSEEFRRDAVELYRVTDGATFAEIAADLGIAHGSLSAWLRAAGIAIRRRGHTEAPPGPVETPEQETTRLRARVRPQDVAFGVQARRFGFQFADPRKQAGGLAFRGSGGEPSCV